MFQMNMEEKEYEINERPVRQESSSRAIVGFHKFFFKLHIITFNVHKISSPPAEFRVESLFPVDSRRLDFDLIAVGLQEVNYLSSNYLFNELLETEPWVYCFRRFFATRGFAQLSFNSFGATRMMGMCLLVFVKRPLLSLIRKTEIKYIRTGFGGYSGHKGAVCCRITIGPGIHITLINCHLAADISRIDYRIWEFKTIMEQCCFESPFKLTDDDYVFWFGDLNFRVQNIISDDVIELIEHRQFQRLLDFDQLSILRKAESGFHQFEEAKITFRPTYRYIVGTAQLDVGRMPSYCDRILWRCTASSQANCAFNLNTSALNYESFVNVNVSDHKPVVGVYSLLFYLPADWNLPITFEYPSRANELHWVAGKDNFCRFLIRSDYEPSCFDWMGVFKLDFSTDRDTLTYVYMVTSWEEGLIGGAPLHGLLFKARSMPPAGLYILACYSTAAQCIISTSDPFEIIDPQVGTRHEILKPRVSSDPNENFYCRWSLRQDDPSKLAQHRSGMFQPYLSQSLDSIQAKVAYRDKPPVGIPHRRKKKGIVKKVKVIKS